MASNSRIPAAVRGPACIFWANLTAFSPGSGLARGEVPARLRELEPDGRGHVRAQGGAGRARITLF